MSDDPRPVVADDRVVRTPPESAGTAPGRGRLAGRRILVVGAGQMTYDLDDPPIGNGRAIAQLCAGGRGAVVCADRGRGRAPRRRCGGSSTRAGTASDGRRRHRRSGRRRSTWWPAPSTSWAGSTASSTTLGSAPGTASNGTPEHWDTRHGRQRARARCSRRVPPCRSSPTAARIVFISSVAGITPGSRIPAYDASKAALGALMRHVGLEGARRGGQGQRCRAGTDGHAARAGGHSRGRQPRGRTPVPLGRQGTGWETAYAVLFLLSDESAYITGQTLVVDGGLTALR